MKAKEIRELTLEELKNKITERSAELAKLKMNHAITPIENPLIIRTNRKIVAGLKTELTKRTKTATNK